MNTEIVRDYIDIDAMHDTLFEMFKEERENYGDDEYRDVIESEFDDERLSKEAIELAFQINTDMKRYLHKKDHAIFGNFNNIDYDYPRHINGEFEYDDDLVKDLIKRLDERDMSERTKSDRLWLNDWFFYTFGTFGIRYNFDETMSAAIEEHEREMATA